MISTAQLNAKLVELNEEFIKIKDSGNAAEAFRWIVSTQEFLRGLLEESETMKHLTARERKLISGAGQAIVLKQHDVRLLLQERIRKENAKMINEKGEYVPDPFVEDKARALGNLASALNNTRQGEHVWGIKLSDDETKAFVYTGRGELLKMVNIDCDGALQAIIDVCKAMM